MLDLGLEVLFKGSNMLRLLQGLWVAVKISLISIAVSMPLGVVVGSLMTVKNKFIKLILRIYLVRWHPLLFLCCGELQKWEIW